MGAAKEYEATFAAKGQKVCTIIAGSGPDDAIKLYHDMAAKELGLQHCYFVGPDVGVLVPEPGGYEAADNQALTKDLSATITQAPEEYPLRFLPLVQNEGLFAK